MPVTGRERGGTQPAGAQKSKLPTKTPSNTKPAKNASAQGAVAKNPSPSPVQRSRSSNEKPVRNSIAQRTDAKSSSSSPVQQPRPLPPTPLEEEKRKVLKGLNNKNIASNNVSDQFVYTLTII